MELVPDVQQFLGMPTEERLRGFILAVRALRRAQAILAQAIIASALNPDQRNAAAFRSICEAEAKMGIVVDRWLNRFEE